MCALHWHMTYKWLSSGQNSPRILESYTLTKTHKNTPVGEPIVSSSRGPTECISSFVDSLSQPIAQKQESCIKETTHFINFIENTPLPVWVILASSTFCSLYTNILHLGWKSSSLFWALFKEGHEKCCSSWLRNDSRAQRLSHNSVTIVDRDVSSTILLHQGAVASTGYVPV